MTISRLLFVHRSKRPSRLTSSYVPTWRDFSNPQALPLPRRAIARSQRIQSQELSRLATTRPYSDERPYFRRAEIYIGGNDKRNSRYRRLSKRQFGITTNHLQRNLVFRCTRDSARHFQEQ